MCLFFSVHVNTRVQKSEERTNDQNDVVSNFDYRKVMIVTLPTHLRTCYKNIFWSVFVCGCWCMDVDARIACSVFNVFAWRWPYWVTIC